MNTTSPIKLAAEHGVFLGAMYSMLSAIYLVSLWVAGASLLWLPLIFAAMFAMSRMHIARRKMNSGYTSYTLWVNTFAVILASFFLYVLILAVGKDSCMTRIADELLNANTQMVDMPGVREAIFDPRTHVVSLALEYWLIGVFLLSPLGNLLAAIMMRLSNRLRHQADN